MTISLWSSKKLYRRLRDDRMDPIPDYFLRRFFAQQYYSADREINISELPAKGRKLAPFILPTSQGKPIAEFKGEAVKSLLPPYIKPKDPVRAVEARNPLPEEIFDGPLTLEQRFVRRTGDIQDQHVRAIRMQIAWMAARAHIDGKVKISYQNDQGASYPEVLLDFGRAANHTVTLTTAFWDDPDYPIVDDVNTWADRMRLAYGGAFPNELLVGAAVAKCFRKNNQVRAEMDKTVRGNEAEIKTGILRFDDPVTPMGTLGGGINVFCYRDTVENDTGVPVEILNPKDILLQSSTAEGVEAYGAVYNGKAIASGQASVDIYPSMWTTDDPADTFLMHESSPLPIPLTPNRTLKATVLA